MGMSLCGDTANSAPEGRGGRPRGGMWSRERDTLKCGSRKGSGSPSPWRVCSASARTALPMAALANRAEIASSASSRDEGAGDRLLPLGTLLDRSVPLFTPTTPGLQRQGIAVRCRPRWVTWESWPRKWRWGRGWTRDR